MKRRAPRWLVQLAALLVTAVAGLTGCVTEFAAEKVIAPPNGGRVFVAADDDRHPSISPFIDDGFRLEVGTRKSKASMMVWVVEPKRVDVFTTPDLDAIAAPTEAGRYSIMKTGPTRQGVGRGLYQVIRYATPDADNPAYARCHLEPKGTVLILQGYSSHVRRNAYLWPWAAVFANAGYRVVMPDLRGHGDSTGGKFTWGVQETADLSQLIDTLDERGLLSGKLAVFGHSTGAAVAIAAAAHDERVACVIAASPWASMRGAIEGFRDWKLPWLSPLLNDGVLDVVARRAGKVGGFKPQEASAVRWIRDTDKPVLLMHGGSDPLLPVWHSRAIYRARPENTQLVVYPRDDHWSLLEVRFEDVRRRSLAWLEQHLDDDAAEPAPPQMAVVD